MLAILGTLLARCGSAGSGGVTSALPTAQVDMPARQTYTAVWPSATALPTTMPTPSPVPTSPAAPIPTALPLRSTDSAATGRVGADADVAAREALLVAEINKVRAVNGLLAYLHSPELSAAARAHSCDLAAHAMISHTSSDGRTLQERLAGSSPAWQWPSESIAAGTDDPATVVAWWMDEPPEGWHRRNILDAEQREVGVGYCYAADDPSGNHHYWTADFSRRGAP
jgi:uncharacterized protein YkwD